MPQPNESVLEPNQYLSNKIPGSLCLKFHVVIFNQSIKSKPVNKLRGETSIHTSLQLKDKLLCYLSTAKPWQFKHINIHRAENMFKETRKF